MLSIPIRRHVKIRGDANQLQQCLLNLMFNAVDAMPDGGTLTLRAAMDDTTDGVVIGVTDTGDGISPDLLPHVFDRFYRVDKSRSRIQGGSGLGLSIVKGLVEAMGGQVAVESAVGEGSCFTVRLPRGEP